VFDFKRQFPRGKSLALLLWFKALHSRSRLLDHFKKRFCHVRYTGSKHDAPQAAREHRNAFTTEDYALKRFAEQCRCLISKGNSHEVNRLPCCCGFRHYFPAAACRTISRSVFALCAIPVQSTMPPGGKNHKQ